MLQLDIKNAFNTVHRSRILEGVGSMARHLLPWAQQSLQASSLLLGEGVVPSSEGAQQGAPLSLFFSLAIHDVISSCPTSLVNVWYLDDGTLVGIWTPSVPA